MKTLKQFKAERNVESIELMKGKGRMFANVGPDQLFVGKDTDLKKDLFVITGEHDAYWLVNSNAKVVATI